MSYPVIPILALCAVVLAPAVIHAETPQAADPGERQAQRLRLEHQIGTAAQIGPGAFLAASEFDLAAAELNERLQRSIAEQADPRRCVLISSQNQRDRPAPDGQSRRPRPWATIEVRLRCDLDQLGRVLAGIEQHAPLLFVSGMHVYQRPLVPVMERGGPLADTDARFKLHGYRAEPAVSP